MSHESLKYIPSGNSFEREGIEKNRNAFREKWLSEGDIPDYINSILKILDQRSYIDLLKSLEQDMQNLSNDTKDYINLPSHYIAHERTLKVCIYKCLDEILQKLSVLNKEDRSDVIHQIESIFPGLEGTYLGKNDDRVKNTISKIRNIANAIEQEAA